MSSLARCLSPMGRLHSTRSFMGCPPLIRGSQLNDTVVKIALDIVRRRSGQGEAGTNSPWRVLRGSRLSASASGQGVRMRAVILGRGFVAYAPNPVGRVHSGVGHAR